MSVSVDIRHGRYQHVMRDVECDACITDAPYSPRTHKGQRTGSSTRKTTIQYDALTPAWCVEFAEFWAPRTKNWAIVFCDHKAFGWHEEAWQAMGWNTFAPVFLKENPPPRFSGDGPAFALEFMLVARRASRRVVPMGSFRSYYPADLEHDRAPDKSGTAGRKPLSLMRAIIDEYTEPGALIADACSGSGTTLVAAGLEGRSAIGSEERWRACESAAYRISKHKNDFRQQALWKPGNSVGQQTSLLEAG